MNPFSIETTTSKQAVFMNRVYAWMSGALLVTAFVAWWAATTPAFLNVLFPPEGGINKLLFYGLIGAEIGLVFWISARIQKMTSERASLLFVIYAILNGLTLSTLFIAYTTGSIASTFFVTAGTFGAMSLYGYTTKKDLSSWGNILFMALIGLIISSLVNIFLQSSTFYWIVNSIGVLVFVGLTAYDTQKIKQMANQMNSEEEAKKGAVIGALSLYLDFINLFIFLLRFLGDRR
ncbi:Bax inhibitor-1/YccA family protein [Ochrovirga pacifica]|uniref:Bax inhibitor-1/YccA family protein n=1 Tax=Ochrovirga pacifica TaxID=1042376 RepID=UPI000255A27A|nr:Bax inhibitor-1/YccA family protein [Ochrovirga pacifica]